MTELDFRNIVADRASLKCLPLQEFAKALMRVSSQKFQNEKFFIISLEDFFAQPDMFPILKIQDFYSLVFIQEGRINKINQTKMVELEEGSIFVAKPGQISVWLKKWEVSGFLICFSKQFLIDLEENKNLFRTFPYLSFFSESHITVPSKDRAYFNDLFTKIYSEVGNDSDISKELIRLWMLEALFQIRQCWENEEGAARRALKSHIVHQFLEYIEDYFIKGLKDQFVAPLSIGQIADELCIHPSHLSNSIKKSLGKTAKTIITERYLLAAQSKLTNTLLPISEIAYMLGFENPSYFSRFFKKHTGITPQEYRQSNFLIAETESSNIA